jgi:carbon-monoxide dehydrogenase small subunit
MTVNLSLTVNGQPAACDVKPRLLLVHLRRKVLGLTGPERRLRYSVMRRCTVNLDGESVKSCSYGDSGNHAVTASFATTRRPAGLARPVSSN